MFKTSSHHLFSSLRRAYTTPAYTATLATLKTDLKAAMRAKDVLTRDTIKSILATIKNKELDTDPSKHTEFLLHELLTRSIKQRVDSAAEYNKLGRADLQEKELAEVTVIETYLKQLPVASEEDVKAKVLDFLKGVEGKNVGEVMGLVDWSKVKEEWGADEKVVRKVIAQTLKK